MNAAPASYMSAVEAALGNGATREQVVDALIAVLPVIGSSRVVSAAPNLALALGYDVDAALEELHGSGSPLPGGGPARGL